MNCANCGRPIRGRFWAIEVDGRHFHAARYYQGEDRRRCRDVAEALVRQRAAAADAGPFQILTGYGEYPEQPRSGPPDPPR